MASDRAAACDVVVIGAGHAGIEAALAAARLGARVVVVTLRRAGIGQLSCNPAIGGVGKGHLVREIDALGGAMARVADQAATQFRRLNASRGPAVRARRVQVDADAYREAMRALLEGTPGVTVLEDEVVDLSRDAAGMTGALTRRHGALAARAVVVTAGTFLGGVCHVGAEQVAAGRAGDAPAQALSSGLRRLGIRLQRFKTGTTPRLAADSIEWTALVRQDGDTPPPHLAFDPPARYAPQQPCFVTYTNEATHALVRQALPLSPMAAGTISGHGPRYCPSLEDKVVRFADRARHQIFLEVEGARSDRIYPNGLSTSLPRATQEAFLRTIAGLAHVRVLQHGYAVEYDYAPPTQLDARLMVRAVPGLFMAGQVNGTSGYEEAAAQGLFAGLAAVRFLDGAPPPVLRRDQAYLGVLVDDLTGRGVDEPYRMFTARAEHRLVLRESNAEARLAPLAAAWGLLSAARADAWRRRAAVRAAITEQVARARLDRPTLARLGWEAGDLGVPWEQVLRRPEISLARLLGPARAAAVGTEICAEVEEACRYAGYIRREEEALARVVAQQAAALPAAALAQAAPTLSREVREKMLSARPATLGEAARLPGMTPVALALLRTFARRAAHDQKDAPP